MASATTLSTLAAGTLALAATSPIVRAKFLCTDKMMPTVGLGISVTMQAVVDNDPDSDNARWAAATPSGFLQLGVMKQEAADAFDVGREYYLDFSAVGVALPAPSRANDLVAAVVPDAAPEHIGAAIEAHDAATAAGGDLDAVKAAAVLAATTAGASDVQAQAIAAAIPVLVTDAADPAMPLVPSADPAPAPAVDLAPAAPSA